MRQMSSNIFTDGRLRRFYTFFPTVSLLAALFRTSEIKQKQDNKRRQGENTILFNL